MPSSGLRIPKLAVQVEIHLRERQSRRVEIFLAEQGPRDPRPESVIDRLEDDEAFFPGRDPDSGEWMFVNKDAIVWAEVPQDAATLSLEEQLFDHRRPVRVEVLGSEALDGELLYSAPETRARPIDYLNRPGRFVRVHRDGGLALVGKRWIVRVLET